MEHSNPNKLLDATYILYAHFGAYDLLCVLTHDALQDLIVTVPGICQACGYF